MSFRLVVITLPGPATPRELEIVQGLFRRGLQTLHLRKPGSSPEAVAQYLSALPPEHRRRTVLHQHHELAKTTSIGGIHFRESDRPPGVIKAPPGLSVSTSFHSLPDLGVCRGEVDYCFLSPIFQSISKQGYPAAFTDHEELASGLAGSRYPVLALGGVTEGKFSELQQLGFAGAALLGSVWEVDDPEAALMGALREAERLG